VAAGFRQKRHAGDSPPRGLVEHPGRREAANRRVFRMGLGEEEEA